MANTTLFNFDSNVTLAPEEDDEMSTAKKMHWATSVVIGTIFVIIGLVGNTFSILVWSRKKMRCSTGTYLIAQAIADSGLLVFFFLTDSIKMIDPSIVKNYSYGVFFCYIGYPIFFLFVILSIWYTVGVTVDRYIQVCWFTHAKKMCNHKKAFTGIGIITLLCFIINAPHFNTFTPMDDWAEGMDSFDFSDFGKGKGSQNYEFWVHCMFLVLAPVVTIFTLNMLILTRVAKMNREMKDKRGEAGKEKARKSERQLTRLLLTVTFTFLILIAFQCIVQCFFMLRPGSVNFKLVDEAFSIAKLGIVINSSVNFFLYCLSAKRFRKELQALVCRGYVAMDTDTSSSMKDTSSSVLSRSKQSVKKTMSSM